MFTNDAAKYLGLRPQTIRAWPVYSGPVKPQKHMGRNIWSISEMDEYLKAKRQAKTPRSKKSARFSEEQISYAIKTYGIQCHDNLALD